MVRCIRTASLASGALSRRACPTMSCPMATLCSSANMPQVPLPLHTWHVNCKFDNDNKNKSKLYVPDAVAGILCVSCHVMHLAMFTFTHAVQEKQVMLTPCQSVNMQHAMMYTSLLADLLTVLFTYLQCMCLLTYSLT